MSIENEFRALTPSDHIDLRNYQEALDYVFSLDMIRNIALTGAYGSGKSSVIRSYEQIHTERTFIHISLAHFDEQGKSADSNATDSAKIVNDLEGKIINQLIHQIPAKNIPQSLFQLKSELSPFKRFLIVSAILVFVILWIFVLKFHSWVQSVSVLSDGWMKSILLTTVNPYFRLTAVLLIVFLSGVGLFYFLSTHSLQTIFKRVDLKGIIGLELFGAEDDTYFDKYLNNVLCLFDAADADGIVFEDLDRYDVTLIFEKLREINDLAYNRTKQGLRPRKKPLRFFYLIRDDVFTAADRSKFFDFIIPVVPYVDASNSCEQLLQQFDEAGISGVFNKRFLQDVSLYLSDMRLITNIVNEYIVYHGRLNSSGLETKPDRQLAMVIYKNIYPGDFDLLHRGRGYVFALFENKSTMIEEQRQHIDITIAELRRQLVSFDQEHLKNVDELNALFFPLFVEIITVGGKKVENLDRTELVKRILQNPDDVYYREYGGPYSYTRSLRFETADKQSKMESNPEYSRRKKILESRKTKRQEFLDDIKKLEEQELRLSTFTSKELLCWLDKEAEDAFWNPVLPSYESEGYIEKIQNSKNFNLLKYLIRNGYIDENYAAYISYFYPNSLTVQDRNFLLALSDRSPLDYGYHLDRPDAILDRLDIADFTRRELRNFDLLSYLLRHKCNEQLHAWLKACDGDNDAYQFLIQFWCLGNLREDFIHTLYKEHPTWFRLWSEDGILKGSDWQLFVLDILKFLNQDQLKKVNEDNWLASMISTDQHFLKIDQPDISTLIPALKKLDVQFQSIDYREQDIPLVEAVYQENLYVLNLPMLKLFLKIYWGVSSTEAEQRSYSYILHTPDTPLSKRVFSSIEIYLDVILHESSIRFTDDEDAICNLLNREDLSEEYKLEYIQRMGTILESINSIEMLSLWHSLVENCCLKYTWENMADYFAELDQSTDELPVELAAFVDSGTDDLKWNYDDLNNRIGKGNADRLRNAVLSNQSISLERFRTALAGMTFEYHSGFPLTDIPDDRMKIILELNIAPMTVKNIEVIRKNYPQFWNDFVFSTKPSALLKLIDSGEITLTVEEIADLLEDNRIDTGIAANLVDSFSGTIPLQNRDYPSSTKAKIIQEHLNPNEIPMLLQLFEQETSQVCAVFLQYSKEHIDLIASSAEVIQYIPIKVYSYCLDEFTESQALKLRPYLANKDFEIVCTENRNPKFKDTPEVRKILKFYKEKSWISNYKFDKGFIRAFSTRK